jgi:hypothetical protein
LLIFDDYDNPEQVDLLHSQHVLAGVYQANGQYIAAIALLQDMVFRKEKTLAEEHPHRRDSQHELVAPKAGTALQYLSSSSDRSSSTNGLRQF